MIDFEAFDHPLLAVKCPSCGRGPGQWCRRPSGHPAMNLHAPRAVEADRAFVESCGDKAWIENLSLETSEPKDRGPGIWRVHRGAAVAA